jgi:hypothetical protein
LIPINQRNFTIEMLLRLLMSFDAGRHPFSSGFRIAGWVV